VSYRTTESNYRFYYVFNRSAVATLASFAGNNGDVRKKSFNRRLDIALKREYNSRNRGERGF